MALEQSLKEILGMKSGAPKESGMCLDGGCHEVDITGVAVFGLGYIPDP